jgi:hypothetical protein
MGPLPGAKQWRLRGHDSAYTRRHEEVRLPRVPLATSTGPIPYTGRKVAQASVGLLWRKRRLPGSPWRIEWVPSGPWEKSDVGTLELILAAMAGYFIGPRLPLWLLLIVGLPAGAWVAFCVWLLLGVGLEGLRQRWPRLSFASTEGFISGTVFVLVTVAGLAVVWLIRA